MSDCLSITETRKKRSKPRLAITVGDVAGVGPEISLAAAADPFVREHCQPILLGPANILWRVSQHLQLELPPTASLDQLDHHTDSPALVVNCGNVSAEQVQCGQFSPATGRASFEAVDLAIEETMSGAFDAIVTGPIQKEAWHAAETGYLGHTELLADRTGTTDFCMMLSGSECSTVLVTIHLPLIDAIEQLSPHSIARAIRLGGQSMQKRHGRPPRITVLGLNPHAGENGLLSHGEEEAIIQPAIDQCRQDHTQWQITGPVPPDTAFTPAMRRQTDVHICMYHDQGLIPLKALSFDDGVNVTLGLPIVRTSVDHGTAMDLAWKGKAKANSMLSAISMAIQLC